jgi:hypothetical protein
MRSDLFIALVVFVPLIYIVAALASVRCGVFASTAAARDAGREFGTAPTSTSGCPPPRGPRSWPSKTSRRQ